MNQLEYIFTNKDQVHVLQTKPSANSKLGHGYLCTTYHFSISQVQSNNFKDDTNTCFNCPFSFNMNGGKSGGCYTHKGLMLNGLRSMLKRLHRLYNEGKIKEYNKQSFNRFIDGSAAIKPVLVRLASYGEPCTLDLRLMGKLVRLSDKHTGYSHMWQRPELSGYSKYLMASTHGYFESLVANSLGWRAFESSPKADVKTPVCPASKEFGKKLTCIECGACGGVKKGQTNNIFIKVH